MIRLFAIFGLVCGLSACATGAGVGAPPSLQLVTANLIGASSSRIEVSDVAWTRDGVSWSAYSEKGRFACHALPHLADPHCQASPEP